MKHRHTSFCISIAFSGNIVSRDIASSLHKISFDVHPLFPFIYFSPTESPKHVQLHIKRNTYQCSWHVWWSHAISSLCCLWFILSAGCWNHFSTHEGWFLNCSLDDFLVDLNLTFFFQTICWLGFCHTALISTFHLITVGQLLLVSYLDRGLYCCKFQVSLTILQLSKNPIFDCVSIMCRRNTVCNNRNQETELWTLYISVELSMSLKFSRNENIPECAFY